MKTITLTVTTSVQLTQEFTISDELFNNLELQRLIGDDILYSDEDLQNSIYNTINDECIGGSLISAHPLSNTDIIINNLDFVESK
jgi:hypothetical protein